MSIHYFGEPELILPDMVCAWPGIGQVAQTVAETLRDSLDATLFAEIDPAPFFYPRRVTVHKGLLEDMDFPASRFYFSHAQERDIIIFIGEAQPGDEGGLFAEGHPTYCLANAVLDVAEKFHCRRIYTSGAAVTQIHHSTPSLVWAVPNDPSLIDELTRQQDVVLMSRITDDEDQGFVSGLNGLLVGVARKRGLEAVCLMGEVPYYVQGLGQPYPAAAEAVLEVLANIMDLTLDLSKVRQSAKRTEQEIDRMLRPILADKSMAELKRNIEALKQARRGELGPITDKEQQAMVEHIEDLFKTEDGNNRRLV